MRKLKNDELERISPEEFRSLEKLNACIVLDNIRSMNNIGSAFRTADAFAVESIYLTGISATPPHRDIHKTALGATETVTWQYEKETTDLVKKLKAEGYLIVAVEQADKRTWLQEFHPSASQKYALVFGNEVTGVSDEIMPLIDLCLEIPQFGTKHSLNVSVAMGVVLWEFLRSVRF